MNERIVNIDIGINKLDIKEQQQGTAGDTNSHFINLKFVEEMELTDYELLVMYKMPYPDSTVLVDKYSNLQQEMNILIPNKALKRSGKVTVEFALKQDEKLITVNKNLKLDVISTINSTYLKAAAEGELLETITEQIAKIEELINTSDKKIEEYNQNTEDKIVEFNKYVKKTKLNIDDYVNKTSKDQINDYITNTANKNIDNYVKEKEAEIKGATFTPSVSTAGVLTFTNDKNLPNPPAVNIQGPMGPVGPVGPKPVSGVDYNTLTEKEEFKNEIIKQFDKIKLNKGKLPLTIENAEAIYNTLQASVGLKFDDNLLYLNDTGIKKRGYCYLDRLTDGIFECTVQTTETVNNSAKFKNFSNKANFYRLNKLINNFSVRAKGEKINITDSTSEVLQGLNIFGKSIQNGIPTLSAPIQIESTGDKGNVNITIENSTNSQTLNVLTQNGLRGLKVTDNENYIDSTGQKWITDEIDFKYGKHIKRIEIQIFDGTEKWYESGTGKALQEWCGEKELLGSSAEIKGYCCNYAKESVNGAVNASDSVFLTHNKSNVNWILFYNSLTFEQWKQFLVEKYAENNPVCIYYILAVPVETELSSEQIEAYKKLYLNYPATVINNDSNAGMEVEYVVDIKNYIDKKIGG